MKKSKIDQNVSNQKVNNSITKAEIHKFGIQMICSFLQEQKHDILDICDDINTFPSIITEKNEQLYAIVAHSEVAPNWPVLSFENQLLLTNFGKKYNMIPCFARIAFGSTTQENYEKGLMLHNDNYHIRYEGLELIPMDEPEKGTREQKARTLYKLGLAYKIMDISIIEDLVANNCKWYSEFSEDKYKGKKEILKYYKNKFANISDSESSITFEVVEYKGIFKDMAVDKLHFNGKVFDNAHVKILQEDTKLALLLEQTLNGETNGLLIDVSFNKDVSVKSFRDF